MGFAIAAALGFHNLFFASAGMATIALLCSLFARERRVASTQRRPAWTFRNGLIARDSLPLAWLAFCLGMGIGPLNTFLAIFAQTAASRTPAVLHRTGLRPAAHPRIRRSTRRSARTSFVMIPGMIGAASAIALLPLAHDLPHFFVSAVLWGVGFGSAQPASLALLVDRTRGEQRGLALSTYFMGFDIGIGMGAIASASSASHSAGKSCGLPRRSVSCSACSASSGRARR